LGAAPFEKIQRVETLQGFIYTYIFVYIYYVELARPHLTLICFSFKRHMSFEHKSLHILLLPFPVQGQIDPLF